jgi:hypothetical protein
MDNEANLHGTETPDALASSATPAQRTLMNEGMNAIRTSAHPLHPHPLDLAACHER